MPIPLQRNSIKQTHRIAQKPPIFIIVMPEILLIVILVVHRRESLEQCDVFAAIVGRMHFIGIICLEPPDVIPGIFVIIRNTVDFVMSFKPFNQVAMQCIPTVEQAAGADVIPDSFQPFGQLFSCVLVLDADKARGYEFHSSFSFCLNAFNALQSGQFPA